MAKKSTATRQANAARRSQTTARASGATLVRAQPHEVAEAKEAHTQEAKGAAGDTTVKQAKPASGTAAASTASTAKPRVAPPAVERPRVLEAPKVAKTAPKPEAAPARQPSARTQATRVARARATQRARTANIVTPEHYAYVLKDLRLIAALAITMFTVIIVLHFVLG